MDSILPRGSVCQISGHEFNTEKCVIQSNTTKFHLGGGDLERLSKIKLAIPPMQNARIDYCMRGNSCRLDILNLTQENQSARVYMGLNKVYLATAPKGSVSGPDKAQLGTKRALVQVPQSKSFQNAVIATPVVLTPSEQLRCSGQRNIVGGGRHALTASTSLASSTLEMTLAAGQTSVALVRYLAALSRGPDAAQFIDLSGGLAHLATHGQALGVATSQTAFDLAHVGLRLLQTLYGAGQYTYASAQKPQEAPQERQTPQTTLVDRADMYETFEPNEEIAHLSIDIGENIPVVSQEDELLEEFGFEKLSLPRTGSVTNDSDF